jgi:replicative DNA helicase
MFIDQVLAEYVARPPETKDRVSSGFEPLDGIVGGFAAGQVWIVTGGPGQGSTTLLTQWALHLAGHGMATTLVCPREPRWRVIERLLALTGPIPLLDVQKALGRDQERLEKILAALRSLPLHIAAQGDSSLLDSSDDPAADLPPTAVLIDDADLVAGALPGRVQSLARQGSLVVMTMPKHLVIPDTAGDRQVEPEWARVADVVLEVRQAGWPFGDDLRPGEADVLVLKNRWGPTRVATVAFQGHYSRFVDMTQ